MKKLLLFLLLTTGTGLLQAQIAFNSYLDNETTTGFAAGDKSKNNIVKLNLMGLPLKNFSFQYERVITKRLSVAVGIRTMPTGSLPFANSFATQVGDGDPELEANIRAVKVGNFAVTPEVRLYLSRKGYGRGFYIAPYYRYAKFTSDELPVDYDGDGKEDILLAGNFFPFRVQQGRCDAGIGLLLKGDGKGGFTALDTKATGLFVNGDVRDMTELKSGNRNVIVISKNNDWVQVITKSNRQ